MATNKNEKLTMFDNPEIDKDDLPKAGEVSWQAMDRKLVRRLLTEAFIALMFVSIGAQWFLLLPLAWMVGPFLGYGLLAVWLVNGLGRALQTLLFVRAWQGRQWQRLEL